MITKRPDLQFFNLFFEIGFMFLFDIGIGGILHLQKSDTSYHMKLLYSRICHLISQFHYELVKYITKNTIQVQIRAILS